MPWQPCRGPDVVSEPCLKQCQQTICLKFSGLWTGLTLFSIMEGKVTCCPLSLIWTDEAANYWVTLLVHVSQYYLLWLAVTLLGSCAKALQITIYLRTLNWRVWNWTWDLLHAKQVLYHWDSQDVLMEIVPIPDSFFQFFLIALKYLCPGGTAESVMEGSVFIVCILPF